ncbi:MAG: amylo-alpha-1,6-glucosidase [Planctomycetota bacterium]
MQNANLRNRPPAANKVPPYNYKTDSSTLLGMTNWIYAFAGMTEVMGPLLPAKRADTRESSLCFEGQNENNETCRGVESGVYIVVMLAMQKTSEKAGICVETGNEPVEQLLEKEWLLTNTRGGYSSSTVVGCNTRRYHGLLVGSLEPPVKRILALANCLETVFLGPGEFKLSTFEFTDKITPEGYLRLKGFRKDYGVHFYYEIGELRLTKSVYLSREQDTAAIVYEFGEVLQPIEFTVQPFVAMRDFHSLQRTGEHLTLSSDAEQLVISNETEDCGVLLMNHSGGIFEEKPQWWFNFAYRSDRERGQDFKEDLFCPGVIKYRVDSPTRIILWANLSREYKHGGILPDIEEVIRGLSEHYDAVAAAGAKGDKILAKLYQAGEQFVVKRRKEERKMPNVQRPMSDVKVQDTGRTTILAGFPWFADWGRDAFLSLPGLLLATRRLDEAKSILLTFAQAASEGMIPNCFDDYGGGVHFNSVDASLWFVNAAFAYLAASGDRETFKERLLPTIISIIDSYRRGTRFGIRADADGLITAGDSSTQLTWMDAKYDGVVFTPRYGKCVEVNSLWFNALMLLNRFYDEEEQPNRELKLEIDKVKKNFSRLFWNEEWGWLNDCILPDGTADATLRPNQIFAVSLSFSPLTSGQQKAVVDIVEEKLLTPYGLRTLSPDDRRYCGAYTGGQSERDGAYHQGTVWPYLIGPFVEAYLRVHGLSRKSKKQALHFIEPLLNHLTEDGCLGQVSEIFDGDPPHKPKGCFSQAWSVAELIRAYLMVV